jgi:trimeric autotransporter adhesin
VFDHVNGLSNASWVRLKQSVGSMVRWFAVSRAPKIKLEPDSAEINGNTLLCMGIVSDDSRFRANWRAVLATPGSTSATNQSKQMKTLYIAKPISRLPFRCGFFILSIALCWFALSPALEAGCPTSNSCGGQNTAAGENALSNNTSGVWNVGVGFEALFNNLTGNQNTAIGFRGLFSNVGGDHSVAIGGLALSSNISGNDDVGVGFQTLANNTVGNSNTGMGFRTLANNKSGSDNTAIGWNALFLNQGTAAENTAIGSQALRNNIGGDNNTATGFQALLNNNTDDNTAVGAFALLQNTTGGTFNGTFLAPFSSGPNTALGTLALANNVDGGGNTAVGFFALGSTASGIPEAYCTAVGFEALASDTATNSDQGTFNTGLGAQALPILTTGISNTAVGALAGQNLTTGSQNTFVGVEAGSNVSTASNVTCIGRFTPGLNVSGTTFIAGIFGVVPPAGSHFVMVGPSGQLSDFSASSRRFKKDIAPIDKISEGILALKPVTFHYKNDNTNEPEFGLVAEDVVEVNPDWITRDREGEIFGVRYEVIPILLLNEFLKEHKKVEEQQSKIENQQASIAELKSTVALQQKGMEVLTAQLKEQAAQIQKVSAQLETSKPAPQVVTNSP